VLVIKRFNFSVLVKQLLRLSVYILHILNLFIHIVLQNLKILLVLAGVVCKDTLQKIHGTETFTLSRSVVRLVKFSIQTCNYLAGADKFLH
jgi:hypothetical protein